VKIIVIDFETLYTRDYSLSRLTTEEYIRDPQFETIGVAVQVDDGEPEWFSGTKKQIKAWLDQFDWQNSVAVAHNAAFDMAILNWHFDIRPKRIADTLSMARALDGPDAGNSLAKLAARHGAGTKGDEVINALGKRRLGFTPQELARYGAYCCNDVALTHKLFAKMAQGFPLSELRLIDLTIRMFTEPKLCLEKADLELHLEEVRRKKADLLGKSLISKDNLMSNPQLAETLRSLDVEPPMKISPTTGKETYAFAKNDEEFKALLEHENPIVQAIVAARLGVKSTLEESRTERFIGISERGTLPVPLRYYAAHTGRWGGCLVDDTEVIVYNTANGVETKRIVDVLFDDLVWDGEEFVPHEGVVFSGYAEVIEWDGVKGTEDHVVFTDAGEISLRAALQGEHRITAARSPIQDDVDTAARLASFHEAED
jgi:DNA polymerase